MAIANRKVKDKIMRINAEPQFSVPVSNGERKLATKLRDSFEKLLAELDSFHRFLDIFFNHVEDMDSNTELKSLGPLVSRYSHKLKAKFNEFMNELEKALINYQTGFVDTKLDNIKDLIIENIKNMRSSLIELLKRFRKLDEPEFIRESRNSYESLLVCMSQMNTIVKEELFNHIDYNILGRIRLGLMEAPLTIRG